MAKEKTTIRKSDGRHQKTITGPDGKRHYAYGETREECLANFKDLKKKLEAGLLVDADKMTVKEWLLEWLESRVDFRPNTHQNNWTAIHHHLIPEIGHVRLKDLSRRRIQEMVSHWIKKEDAPGSIKLYLQTLHSALTVAVQDNIIQFNPVDYVVKPRVKKQDHAVLTLEQFRHLLDVVDDDWIAPIIVVGLLLGLRVGEITGLKWSDVDFVKKTISIKTNLSYVRGQFSEGPPKTETSECILPLLDFVRDVLWNHWLKQLEQKEACPNWQDLNLVFPNKKGGYRFKNVIWYHLQSCIKKAGLPPMSPHGLRRSTATILNELGVDPKVAQAIMRHSTVEMTMDIYTKKASPERVQQALSLLDSEAQKAGEKREN